MKLKLQKISISTTQSVFHITKCTNDNILQNITLLSDTEPSDEFGKKYNKNCLYKTNNNEKVIYHNLYDSSLPYYKSPFYKKTNDQRQGNTYDFQNVTNHKLSSHIADSVQLQNYIYMLEPKTEYGHISADIDVIAWLSSDNKQLTVPTNCISTVIYDYNSLAENLKNNILSDNAIARVLKCVKYNMIYEMPGNIYNDYESGNIAAHVFKAKNQYDCEYNMSYDNSHILQYVRDYTDIDCCNTQLYLKYGNKDCIDNSLRYSGNEAEAHKYNIKLPNIEMIKQINRTNNMNCHSTELYSIDIDVKKMFERIYIQDEDESSYDSNQQKIEKIKENVKYEIRNCVRAIAETIQPANTQLFHVYVNDD